MRAAITIIFNGLHHLKHNNFAQSMCDNFDLWIVIEGSSKAQGSTSWCNKIETLHTSTDGTLKYLQYLQLTNANLIVHHQNSHYLSKDEQFNIGVDILRTKTRSCFLWQVDCDEQWTAQDLMLAENKLLRSSTSVASFQFNHYVKLDMVAHGDWGDHFVNRLWKWKGQSFQSHEPAVMKGQRTPLQMPVKFQHYSYCFDQDVKFKSELYSGHENIYKNWSRLDSAFAPIHIRELFGSDTDIGKSNTYLYKTDRPCVNATNQEDLKSNVPC